MSSDSLPHLLNPPVITTSSSLITNIYDLVVCFVTSCDWILDIITLNELFQLNNVGYFSISLFIIIYSRTIVAYAPKLFYEPKIGNILRILLWFFSPFIHFFRWNEYCSSNILYLRSRNNSQRSYIQIWLEKRIQFHIIHSLPHCLSQSFIELILLYVLLLRENITYNNNPIIYLSFVSSLFSVIICSPIYFQKLYYSLAHIGTARFLKTEPIDIDHYDISTFILNTLFFLLDFIFVLYINAYLIQYNNIQLFSFPSTASDSYTYIFWYYQCLIILIINPIAVIITFINFLIWYNDIEFIESFKQIINLIKSIPYLKILDPLLSFPKKIAIYIFGCFGILIAPTTIQCIIIFILMLIILLLIVLLSFIMILLLSICLQIISFLWMVWLTQSLLWRWRQCTHGFWQEMMLWIKKYDNKTDLIIRLFCVNYHLFRKYPYYYQAKGDSRKNILNFIDNHTNYQQLSFSDIRRLSLYEDSSYYYLLYCYIVGMHGDWKDETSKFNKFLVLTISILYFVTKLIIPIIPICGLIENFNNFGNFVVLLSLIYVIILTFVICLIYKFWWNIWISMHIYLGQYEVKLGYNRDHKDNMPDDNKLYAIKQSYHNITGNMCFKMDEKINELNKYFLQDIIAIILIYLPVDSIDVDYINVANGDGS